jgi:Na+/proline symporter
VSPGVLGLSALIVYLVLLVAVAERARRARVDQTPADHFLAGRHLGVFVLFLTLYATAYSGNSLLGYPAEAYRRGYSWIMATGFMMSIVVVFHALVPRLRPLSVRHGFVTPGDYIRLRFRGQAGVDGLRRAVAVLMVIALGNFLLAQLVAMGLVAHEFTAGLVPYWAGVVGLAGMILLYETLGGMRAVAWTDAAQGILMLCGLGALLVWLLGDAGGLAAATRGVARLRPEAVAVPAARESANWASTIALLGLASVVYPQAIQRIYAARSGAVLKRSLALMTFMPLVTTLVVTLIGLAAIPRFAGLETLEADAVMPRLLAEWTAQGPGSAALATLVFLGALAAIMSTADSVLLSLGSLVAEDLFSRPREAAETTRFGKRVAAAAMLLAVVLALVPELRRTLWRLIELKMELLIQCVPCFLMALHWRRLRAGHLLAGLIVGTAFAVGLSLAGQARLAGVHVGVLGLVLNAALCGVLAWRGEAARTA